jgi:glycine betaine/proline transport system ATP-binding protein
VAKIEIRNVYKIFGPKVAEAIALAKQGLGRAEIQTATGGSVIGLDDVSLSIPAGGIFVIMGLSGSGKSTLIRHLNRLIEPSSGEILYDGRNVLTLDPAALREYRRRQISMVFQGFGLQPHRSVLDNVAYGLIVRGEKKPQAHDTARRWIGTVGLAGDETKDPNELSGGMRQRVGLARALACDTDVILMDEAFSALDPLIRADMQDQLLTLQSTLAKTIVFVTHDLEEALKIGSEIAIMRDGRVVQVGRPREILDRPANEYVARFVQRHSEA